MPLPNNTGLLLRKGIQWHANQLKTEVEKVRDSLAVVGAERIPAAVQRAVLVRVRAVAVGKVKDDERRRYQSQHGFSW